MYCEWALGPVAQKPTSPSSLLLFGRSVPGNHIINCNYNAIDHLTKTYHGQKKSRPNNFRVQCQYAPRFVQFQFLFLDKERHSSGSVPRIPSVTRRRRHHRIGWGTYARIIGIPSYNYTLTALYSSLNVITQKGTQKNRPSVFVVVH